MAQETLPEQTGQPPQRRSRGPTKQFPLITFEEAVSLPKSIIEHGVNGEIQRLTLLRKLDLSPGSSKTRNLIGGSYKYGLTDGSYIAQSLGVTNAGRVVSGSDYSPHEVKENEFELAIGQFSPFKTLYDKLKGNRLRDGAVLQDELQRAGICDADCPSAAAIFTANLRFLGLVYEVTGNDYVRSIDQVLEEMKTNGNGNPPEPSSAEPVSEITVAPEPNGNNGNGVATPNRPGLHIDIQVHIDPASSAEQIDHIFESMARHFYRLES